MYNTVAINIHKDITMNEKINNILDLNPIFKGDRKTIDFSFEFFPECFDVTAVFETPAKAVGRVYEKAASSHGSESLVMLEIKLEGEYRTVCARCLEDICVPYDIDSEYAVANKLQNEEEDGILFAKSGLLDIREVADALFSINFPSKHLCTQDCKGICQGCGINLNEGQCTCTKKNIDPRLAVLKKLLDKSEN